MSLFLLCVFFIMVNTNIRTMTGHVLMVKTFYENMKMVFLCVYAPVLSMNKMIFLKSVM